MANRDAKEVLANIICSNGSISIGDLIDSFSQDFEIDSASAEEYVIVNLATFSFWDFLDREKLTKERLVCLTEKGRCQIEKVIGAVA